VNRELGRTIRARANGRCEYCGVPQFGFPVPFQIDHVGPRIVALTEIGRVTVQVLAMNAADMLSLRAELLHETF
jgi:hypothetical protein